MLNFKLITMKQKMQLRLLLIIAAIVLIPGLAWAQAQTVRGKVIDGTTQEPLIGVSVVEAGTTTGTITDIDGNFTLSASPDGTLRISYVGYTTREIPINRRTTIEVSLAEDNTLLDEVVVVGYGVQKKATLSGSVTSVRGDEIVKAPVMNVSNSLAGRMPGVVVISNNRPLVIPQYRLVQRDTEIMVATDKHECHDRRRDGQRELLRQLLGKDTRRHLQK